MRQAKAIAIVVALILFVPATGFLFREEGATDAAELANAGINASALSSAGDVDAMLERLEALAESTESPPAWFSDEIGILPEARNVRVSGSVVGYSVTGDSDKTLQLLRANMFDRGWTCVSLGGLEGATFVKESGVCTWALVTCAQVGSTTSVVVRCSLDIGPSSYPKTVGVQS